MSLAVRLASMPEDRDALMGVYQRNFADLGEYHEQRYDWHQTLNPAGPGCTWLLYERSTKDVVGATSMFPRRMYINGREQAVGQVLLFNVDSSHRSLGPAVMLQRATFDPVDRGDFVFCYDCPPHDHGMSTFVRIGLPANCEMIRYTLPLRVNEYVEKKLGTGLWTKPLVSTANLLLRVGRVSRNLPGLEISQHGGDFGEEFSYLDKAVSSSGVIRTCRSAEILNWLYRKFPFRNRRPHDGKLLKPEILVARRKGELLGFVVFRPQTDNQIAILDLFGRNLPEVGCALLEAVAEIGVRDNIYGIYGNIAEGSDLSRLFRSAGFRPRERAARVVSYEKTNGHAGILNAGLRWGFSQIELML